MDSWDRQKLFWLSFRASSEQVLATISVLCEKPGHHEETILWLSTRGSRGQDVDGPATLEAAMKVGGFKPREGWSSNAVRR